MNDNVINLLSLRFPVSTKAWHPVHRICRVIKSVGHQRTIQTFQQGVLEFIPEIFTVHVNELKKLDDPFA